MDAGIFSMLVKKGSYLSPVLPLKYLVQFHPNATTCISDDPLIFREKGFSVTRDSERT
jgi:hypothetical protein